ncbi:hypothetical protein B1750_gp013 [Noumeavirus]|uniref:Peptidase S74 domain-containing protein n=1 Tax=Marseillevirus sp. TaxID=2809551 RepID=A0AA96IYZ1_9VIRU|nr:hypothetical protein B1750_gp013 [Noumeavirus]AQM72994.1 hypothetical protein NMV_013 [Noumeavirus]WNL50069.1 hypothetical protein MarDSR_030 [Marseillevirus sp.]
MSSTSNSTIKKEYVVSRNLVVPIVQNIAAVPEPTFGSIVYNLATSGLVISNGVTWATPTASAATPTARGIVFASTSTTIGTTTSYGNLAGSAPGGNVFLGWRAGFNNVGAQTGLTFVGHLSGSVSQNVTNKTVVGRSSGINANSQQNSCGVGTFCLSGSSGSDNCATGLGSNSIGTGSGNCGIGATTVGGLTSQHNNDTGVGFFTLAGGTSSSGIVNVGTAQGSVYWNPGTSVDVVYLGNNTSLSSNITNVVALGMGSFTGAVANNTLVVENNVSQWRSLGLTVAASANILQFDPVTGLITQAASSKRFKQKIRPLPEKHTEDIFRMKVKTYEISGQVDHGVISEEVPEKYATFDNEGRRNGVKLLPIIMSILSEIQKLRKEILASE